MSESETGRDTILAVGAACGEPVRKALAELLDIFEGQVKRQHAHELAEKIRAASVTGDTNWDAVTWTRGMKHGADLIDPEVSNSE